MKWASVRSQPAVLCRCLPPGEVYGAYRVLRRLDCGDAGSIYEAEHTSSGERVAVEIHVRRLATDEWAKAQRKHMQRKHMQQAKARHGQEGAAADDVYAGLGRALSQRLALSRRREPLYTGAVIRKAIDLEAVASRASQRQGARVTRCVVQRPTLLDRGLLGRTLLGRTLLGQTLLAQTWQLRTWLGIGIVLMALLLGIIIALR